MFKNIKNLYFLNRKAFISYCLYRLTSKQTVLFALSVLLLVLMLLCNLLIVYLVGLARQRVVLEQENEALKQQIEYVVRNKDKRRFGLVCSMPKEK